MNEFKLIDKYLKTLTKNNYSALNLNDDVFFHKKKNIVISVDTYNENYHFFKFSDPKNILTKVIRSSISDLIAKGVKPSYVFISASGNSKNLSSNKMRLISKTLYKEQKKYGFKLSGGDTTNSKVLSFSITSLGFSKNIIKRCKAKLNDDIYVTGNIGDSYIGFKILKKKLTFNTKQKNYFINSYYKPKLAFKFSNYISKIANTSIDISDGILSDMEKLIKNQNLSYKIYVDKIPISKFLYLYLNKYKKNKTHFLFNGDDYQILFTASPNKRKLIKKISNKLNQKITLIGSIHNNSKKNELLFNNKPLKLGKFKGYSHKF